MYEQIVNPETGRKVNIFSNLGQKILNNYSFLEKIKKLTKNSKKEMVILDSSHTNDHVLKVLNLYSPLVRKGNYIICCDNLNNHEPCNYLD